MATFRFSNTTTDKQNVKIDIALVTEVPGEV